MTDDDNPLDALLAKLPLIRADFYHDAAYDDIPADVIDTIFGVIDAQAAEIERLRADVAALTERVNRPEWAIRHDIIATMIDDSPDDGS